METHHDLVGDDSYDSNFFGCSSSGWHHEGGKELVFFLIVILVDHTILEGIINLGLVERMSLLVFAACSCSLQTSSSFSSTSPSLVEVAVAVVKPFGD